jgi:hypothetical protein
MADGEVNGAESRVPSDQVLDLEEEERREEEEKKRAREPPIVYKELLDAKAEFDALLGLIDGKLSEEEQRSMEELQVYMIGDEGSWALSDGFLNFIGEEGVFVGGGSSLRLQVASSMTRVCQLRFASEL